MMKKIRMLYWHMRDRGKKKIFILICSCISLLVLLVGMTGFLKIRQMVRSKVETVKTASASNPVSESAAGTQAAFRAEQESETTPASAVTSSAISVPDFSGLESFLGFMSESSYETMTGILLSESKEKTDVSFRRLSYQDVTDKDVTSYVCRSDGTVFQCRYQLKSGEVSVAVTDYQEKDIRLLQEKKEAAEKKKLEKERKKAKKRLAKKKTKKSKRKKTKKDVG